MLGLTSKVLSEKGLAAFKAHADNRAVRAIKVQSLLNEQDAEDAALFRDLTLSDGIGLSDESIMLDDSHLATFDVVVVKRSRALKAIQEDVLCV